jgi:plastocyanin
MTRRGSGLLVLLAVAALLAALAARSDAAPGGLPHTGCQPDPTNPGTQTLLCEYGPLTVTPGTNLILFGPVTIESPRADGYITRFTPDLVDAVTGEVPPIHEVHLHHGVWLNPRHPNPFFANGEEKTESIIPDGYGYRTTPYDTWVLNYMLHNLTAETFEVLITYELEWTPMKTAQAAGMKEVEPLWFDVVGGAYPVYDPVKDVAAVTDPRDSVVDDARAPSGRAHARKRTFTIPKDYEIVTMLGHVHPGGLRDEMRVERCGGQPAGSRLLFESVATPNVRDGTVPPQSFGSWDFRMTVTPPDWRFTMRQGDQLSLTSLYDVGNPWYEAMGIVFAWAHPVPRDAAFDANLCADPSTTGGSVTHDLPATPVFGGPDLGAPVPTPTGQPVDRVDIAAFTYLPAGRTAGVAPVRAGSDVTFVNLDSAASIFHTVTPCTAPCDGPYGQSYPLPTWDFTDSGQLGYGPPGVTAAKNTDRWTYHVPAGAPAGTTISYFCRIHPAMRGALEVVRS